MTNCPTCGNGQPTPHKPRLTQLRRQLANVDADWTVVRVGASRYLCDKLRHRYPAHEWRHHRNGDAWTIEARKVTA